MLLVLWRDEQDENGVEQEKKEGCGCDALTTNEYHDERSELIDQQIIHIATLPSRKNRPRIVAKTIYAYAAKCNTRCI